MSSPYTAQFTVDTNYRFTWADELFAAIVGVDAAALRQRRAIDYVAVADRVAVTELAARLRDGRTTTATGTCGFRRADGSTFPATLLMMPLYDGSNGAICTVIGDDAPEPVDPVSAAVEQDRVLQRRAEFTARREALAGQREALLADWERFIAERERAINSRAASRPPGPRSPADRPTAAAAPDPVRPTAASSGRAAPVDGAAKPADRPARAERAGSPSDRAGSLSERAGSLSERAGSLSERAAPPVDRAMLRNGSASSAAETDAHHGSARDAATYRSARPPIRSGRTTDLAARAERGAGRFQQDTLTGLDTRALLLSELAAIGQSAHSLSVLLVDLDDFKSINDTYGHEVGDEALVFVAETLRASVRPHDLVVRFGGDEFVVLCSEPDAAPVVAKRIVDQLAQPVQTSAGLISITASVGIGDSSIPAQAADELLGRADAAMYWAKRLGKNRFFIYDEDLHAKVAADRRVEELLHTAVDDGRLLLRYQPIVDMSGRIIGMEAVTRLVDHDGEMLMPDEFLPVATRIGVIRDCDTWVVREACRTAAEIRALTGQDLIISVNVSVPLLAHPDFVQRVATALTDAPLPTGALMLELSEDALLQADPESIDRLTELRNRGIAIAVDGFGLGYSPLAFLRRLPLTHVKMSRPCIAAMFDDERDAAMIEALTWLVDQLGLTWVAEGIETDDQWQVIRQFGPGYGQGFLFAQPLSEPQLIQALTADGIGSGAPVSS